MVVPVRGYREHKTLALDRSTLEPKHGVVDHIEANESCVEQNVGESHDLIHSEF